jgi:flavin-dependent dehydrogenase
MICDIAIVGASTAGLYAAAQLAQSGLNVAVFEQQPQLAPARRTLIITPELRRLFSFPVDSTVLHHIPIMSVVTPNRRVDVELQDPDLIIERGQLTHLLAEKALEAGARIYYGHRFQSLAPAPEGANLQFRSSGDATKTVLARAIIGADGVFSDVALAAGLQRPPTVPILQAEIELPPNWDPSLTRVWFDTTETRFFYWLIPESSTHAVVGLVGDDRAQTRALLRAFLERHGFQPLAYQGAQVAMYHPRLRTEARVGSARVLLVGDAAGQVKVTTVGGSVSGIWGAAAASQALLRGTSYSHELRSLNLELGLHWLIRALMERLDNRGYDHLAEMITPSVQQFLSRRNRDQMAGGIWQLPFLQPRLLFLALRLLRRSSGQTTPTPNLATGAADEAGESGSVL